MKMKKQPETNDLLNYDEAVNFLEHTFDHKGRIQFSVNQRTAIKTVISYGVYLKEEINILKLEIANNKLKNELLASNYCSNGMVGDHLENIDHDGFYVTLKNKIK